MAMTRGEGEVDVDDGSKAHVRVARAPRAARDLLLVRLQKGLVRRELRRAVVEACPGHEILIICARALTYGNPYRNDDIKETCDWIQSPTSCAQGCITIGWSTTAAELAFGS